MTEFFENWTKQVRKGILEFCILSSLRKGDLYAYALVKSLASIKGLEVAEGTIYPLLSRLRKQELVTTRLEESSEGPVRKYYSLTPSGIMVLEQMSSYFGTMSEGIDELKRN